MTHYCSLLTRWALRISQKAPSLNIKTQCTGTNCYNAKKSSKVISTHFTQIAGWEWGSRQFTKYCFAVPQRFFNSIVHVHHNLAKAAYRAENNRNLVELLVSDKADLITFVTLGIGSFQTNPAGLTGSLGTAGTASLGNPFLAPPQDSVVPV